MEIILVIIPLLAGAGISIQSGMNGSLGNKIGTLASAYLSFFTGSIFLTIVVFLFGSGGIFKISEVPFWQLLCALLGLYVVYVMAFSVPVIGVATTTTTVIIGQLTASMAIDHFGWFASEMTPFSLKRFIGVVFMIGALYFVYKEEAGYKNHVKLKKEG